MTRSRRRELEARIIADRKRNPEPEPFTRVVRRARGERDHDPMPPPPVYASREDGPGVRPRVRR